MEYLDKAYIVLKKVLEFFKDKEIYLVGSLSLYLQGVNYGREPDDMDFIIVSDEPYDTYYKYWSMCLYDYGIRLEINTLPDRNFKQYTIPFKFRDLDLRISEITHNLVIKMIYSKNQPKHIDELETLKDTQYYKDAKEIYDNLTDEERERFAPSH